METDKITLPSGETFSKWRFIDIDKIEYSAEHKDKFEKGSALLNPGLGWNPKKELYDKIPINKKKKNKTGGHQTSQEEPL